MALWFILRRSAGMFGMKETYEYRNFLIQSGLKNPYYFLSLWGYNKAATGTYATEKQ